MQIYEDITVKDIIMNQVIGIWADITDATNNGIRIKRILESD
jgi:hypothetical protein